MPNRSKTPAPASPSELIDSLQQRTLGAIEEAEAYRTLMHAYGLTQEQCAERVNRDRSTVANALRLLALPSEIRDDILAGRLTMGHGRAMQALESPELMLRARDAALARDLSVSQIELLCKELGESATESGAPRAASCADGATPAAEHEAARQRAAAELRRRLATGVKIVGPVAGRGRIEIAFDDEAGLARLLDLLLPAAGAARAG
jgi:ParB family chromosome partitioning protein